MEKVEKLNAFELKKFITKRVVICISETGQELVCKLMSKKGTLPFLTGQIYTNELL